MQRTNKAVLVVSAFLTTLACSLKAQEFTRIEVGVDTSILHPGHPFSSVTDVGVGGRFTYNFSPGFSIDSELDYYSTNLGRVSTQAGGRAIMGVFGPKAGIRTRKYGVFLKARAGFMSFSDAGTSADVSTSPIVAVATARKTHAALDLGAVAEFYPSTRTILRLDVGQLLVRYGDATLLSIPDVISVRTPGRIGGPLHIQVGASYRLGALREESEDSSAAWRFAAGAQYSLLTSERGLDTVRDESGLGGFFTWNFSKYFALDSSATFFPRKIHIADFQQGGRMFQALAGIRGGVRRGRIGVFAKFRPGIQRYSLTEQNQITFQDSPFTDVAFDIGGIIEVYTSRRTLLRFDAGNTSIYYRAKDIPLDNGQLFHAPAFTNNTIQITAGFGFRF
jgi:hypothetical protein